MKFKLSLSNSSLVPQRKCFLLLLPVLFFAGCKDKMHNAMAANDVWSFTTSAAPVVIITDPANGASDVALNKIVTAGFSKKMDASTINSTSFLIMQGSNNVPGVVTYSGTTAT